MKKLIDYIHKVKKWRIYLYISNQCVKKIKLKENDEMPNLYVINVYGKKHILGTNRKVKLVVKPVKLKFSDDIKKELHIETKLYEGVDM